MLYIENKSNDGFSKRLYGFPSSAILLDRMNLSARNGWLDEEGRVYIIFTIEEIKGALGCAEKKAVKQAFDQLDGKKFLPVTRFTRSLTGSWLRKNKPMRNIVR